MDKMWPSLLKDGDTLGEAAALFIKSVAGTKTNSSLLILHDGSLFSDFSDEFPFPQSTI